jgi:REP element-mobilizing transposase RayT
MCPEYPHRKANRLQDFDYSSAGYYFVTILSKNRIQYFGTVVNTVMQLNDIGMLARKFWLDVPNHYSGIQLDEFIIMPNHIHGIIMIQESNRTAQCAVPTDKNQQKRHNKLSTIIRSYKTLVKKKLISLIN